jgi:hypothetical protein
VAQQPAAQQQAAERQRLRAEADQLRKAAQRLRLWLQDGALQRASIWRHRQASKCGQEVVSSLSDTSTSSGMGHYVLISFGGLPSVAMVQHYLRLRLAAEDAGGGGRQKQLRLAVVRLFPRMPQPGSGVHVMRTRQLLHRRQAFSVDSIDRMLVSAEPPPGQTGHGKLWLLDYNATFSCDGRQLTSFVASQPRRRRARCRWRRRLG